VSVVADSSRAWDDRCRAWRKERRACSAQTVTGQGSTYLYMGFTARLRAGPSSPMVKQRDRLIRVASKLPRDRQTFRARRAVNYKSIPPSAATAITFRVSAFRHSIRAAPYNKGASSLGRPRFGWAWERAGQLSRGIKRRLTAAGNSRTDAGFQRWGAARHAPCSANRLSKPVSLSTGG